MTHNDIEKANEIIVEIETLKAEVENMKRHVGWLTRVKLWLIYGIPRKKTYYNMYCTEHLDASGSSIILREDEIEMLVKYKEKKINKLEDQLKSI
ncbi:MAG: hypothetical protein ACI3T9_02145 [Romboutsia timonensis]